MQLAGGPGNPLAGLGQNKAANAGNGQFLQGLLGILAAHPDAASQGVGILQSVLGSIGAQQQAHQQQVQANRSGFGQMAATLGGTPGITPEMLTAQLGAVYPNITEGKYGQNAIAGISGALPSATAMTPEEKATLGTALVALAPADGKIDPNDHQLLYDMRSKAKTLAIGAGVDPIEAETLAEDIFGQLSGLKPGEANVIGRPATSTSPYPSPAPSLPSGPTVLSGIAGPYNP
jgi:hypothetical protein